MALIAHHTKITALNLDQFRSNLLAWYETYGRHHLPWRNTDNPYHILVSEIMLQQTQVETVLSRFYHPFLTQFPTLIALAEAPSEKVMYAWQGLGYYRRAGFLHDTAKATAPFLPNQLNELMALPGIGRNTAHAILAFGHHKPYAVMEANVKRIICRIFAIKKPKELELWQHAELLLNKAQPFNHNQAMMDLGSMICAAKKPKCEVCPANHICIGQTAPKVYPAKAVKKEVPIRKKNILIVEDNKGYVYASKRVSALLGGLYQFIELDGDFSKLSLNNKTYSKSSWMFLGHVTQKYSHFTLEASIYLVRYHGYHKSKNWHAKNSLRQLPWSKAEEKILEFLEC